VKLKKKILDSDRSRTPMSEGRYTLATKLNSTRPTVDFVADSSPVSATVDLVASVYRA